MAIVKYDEEKFFINELVVDEKNRFISGKISNDVKNNIMFSKIQYQKRSIDKMFVSDNGEEYTLFNCRFKIKNNDLTILFDSIIIGKKINDFFNEKCYEISLSFDHTNFNIVDVEESLGKEIIFKRNQEVYKIFINFSPRKYTLNIFNSENLPVKVMLDKLIEFYTFISFSIGQYYMIDKIVLKLKKFEKEIFYYPNLNSKYNIKRKDSFTSQVLFKLKEIDVSDTYNKWLLMRKKTHAIFDLYLVALADFQFEDISLSFMINILEGYSKVMHSYQLNKLKKYNKDHKKNGIDLRVILNKFYFQTNYSNLIFPISERKKYKADTKLVNHRNYFDHLDKPRDRYYGHDCTVMFAKLNLIFRVQIFQDLGISLDINKIKKNIEKLK